MNRRLYRSNNERVLGGVAGGVAEYFDLDPALVRVAWAVLILASGGIFLLLYIVMWIVVPEAPPGFLSGQPYPAPSGPGGEPGPSSPEGAEPTQPQDVTQGTEGTQGTPGWTPPPGSIAHEWAGRRAERRRHRSGGGALVFGSLLILLGAWFLVQEYFPILQLGRLWPLLLVFLGALLLYGAVRPRSD